MWKNIVEGYCPFCEIDPKTNKILWDCGTWTIWENPFPHKHQRLHLVMALNRHANRLGELTLEEWQGIGEMCGWAEAYYDLAGGTISMRFGDPALNAGSVRHLHVNIQVPDGTGRVQVTLAKTPEEVAEKKKILLVFTKMRLGAKFEELPHEEQELVKDRLE